MEEIGRDGGGKMRRDNENGSAIVRRQVFAELNAWKEMALSEKW